MEQLVRIRALLLRFSLFVGKSQQRSAPTGRPQQTWTEANSGRPSTALRKEVQSADLGLRDTEVTAVDPRNIAYSHTLGFPHAQPAW